MMRSSLVYKWIHGWQPERKHSGMSAAERYAVDSTGVMLMPESAVGLYDLW